MREIDPERTLTTQNAGALLDKLTWPELKKRLRSCQEIPTLTELVNLALIRLRNVPLFGEGTWKCNHFTQKDLDQCIEVAEDRIQELNRARLSTLRSRSFLDNLLPQHQSEASDGQTRQGPLRRGRTRRLDDETGGSP